MREEWAKYIPYTFSEVMQILVHCKTISDLKRLGEHLREYKKKYPITEIIIIANFYNSKYTRLSKNVKTN